MTRNKKKYVTVLDIYMTTVQYVFNNVWTYSPLTRGCRGHDRMVVGFTTTYAISAYHH